MPSGGIGAVFERITPASLRSTSGIASGMQESWLKTPIRSYPWSACSAGFPISDGDGRARGGSPARLPHRASGTPGRALHARLAAAGSASGGLPRRPRAVPGGGPGPYPLDQAGGGLRGGGPEPDHGRPRRPRRGQELPAGGAGALVALHPAEEPGDHHRPRLPPGSWASTLAGVWVRIGR